MPRSAWPNASRKSTRAPTRLPLTGGYTADYLEWTADMHARCAEKYGDREFDLATQAALWAQVVMGEDFGSKRRLELRQGNWGHSVERRRSPRVADGSTMASALRFEGPLRIMRVHTGDTARTRSSVASEGAESDCVLGLPRRLFD